MADSRLERIHDAVDMFQAHLSSHVLDFRIVSPDHDATGTVRAQAYEDAMIDASNIAMDVEDKMRSLFEIRAELAMQWSEIESAALAKPTYGKYVSDKAKMSEAIQSNRGLFQTLSIVNSAVECGQRAIYRLEALQKASSRALGREIS